MKRSVTICLAVATLLAAAATQQASARQPAKSKAAAKIPAVGMFDAMKAGDVKVRYVARNSEKGTVLIENKTDRPLRLQLPAAFAAVPVLKQDFGEGGGRDRDRGGGGNNNQSQNQGMGGGMFNVAPGKIGKIRVATVCLEHGKKDPTSRIPYEVRPIESFTFTQKAGVAELLTLLGRGKIDQASAQAAAWHLANDMTWNELASKQVKRLGRSNQPYFSRIQILRGVRVSQFAKSLSEKAKQSSPGEQVQASLSSVK